MIYALPEPWLSHRSLRRVIVGVVMVLLALLIGATGSVAAQSAPDCSTVTYNGDGSGFNPYEVENVDQLQCIEDQGLGANYVQVSDIDATGTSSWNFGGGFEPIGEVFGNEFTGTFDGADHTISGLTIDRGSTDDVGVFGFVDSGGRLKNVALENVDINGTDDVGGLVGFSEGTVDESYATGSVSGDEDVGGIVGRNQGTVRKSHATSSVNGTDFVGGIVGRNQGTVRKSHANGSVNGSTDVGGLVGFSEGTVDESSYWDEQASGKTTSDGGTGLNTSDMTGSAATGNMSGFDFSGTWETVSGEYPILVWQKESGDGGSSSPIDDVSNELWTAVTQDDGSDGLSLADLGNAIQQYQNNPSDADVGGVSISLSDLGGLIQYYRNKVA